jgi:sulfocyanin SoxE-like protein
MCDPCAVLAALVAATAGPDPHRFLTVDRAHRAVTLRLVAAYDGENNGFNFDGYGRGELLLSVPLGWRVRIRCENRGPLRHSCAVVPGPQTAIPAFRGAKTGELQAGHSATFSFVASRKGTYRLACLVPGHEEARMWDVLDVGKTRRVEITARGGP